MKSFLSQVVSFYKRDTDKLADTLFILPNRRSALSLREGVKESLAGDTDGDEDGQKKHIGRYISINDFFQKAYGVETTDRIPLLLVLHECYKALNDKAESLDEFIHWGNVMLADFDNIDKYMVDASKVFVNVNDFRSIQDSFQYLTENQRRAVEQFLAHFRDRSGRLTVDMDTDDEKVKARFLRIWNILGPLYASFNEKLSEKGIAYEGKIYRTLAQTIKDGADVKALLHKAFPFQKRFVFVGLNALNECEKTLLRSMRDADVAEFVWDFSSKEIKDPRNKASFFLRKNIEEFPQAFPLDDDQSRPRVHVISVPSSVGQTKLAPQILDFAKRNGYDPGDSVFVLPDENLLMPLISAIPGEYDQVNITMGYPMRRSATYELMNAISDLQMTTRIKDGEVYFHHKAARNLFSTSLFKTLSDEECNAIVKKVQKEAKQFIPMEDLHGTLLTDLFFQPISWDNGGQHAPISMTVRNAAQNEAIARHLCHILNISKQRLQGIVNDTEAAADTSVHAGMELEFIKSYGDALDKLSSFNLNVLPGTWLRLLDGLIGRISVPFEGDTLKGLQVMGTLETRALDFRNVVILSANEDLFPHRSADNSFIPPELRKGFGMPTIEYQDSVWAYYFYRLIQRAENVWMVYDSRTEGLLSGEESRYIKQLQYHFGFPLDRYTAIAPVTVTATEEAVPKTDEDIRTLRENRHLSASSMQSYLYCPAKFYYQAVKGLKTDDEVSESMDAAMLGTLFHSCMEQLYKGKRTVTQADITAMLADEAPIRAMIRSGICEIMRTIDIEGRNLVIEEVVLKYVQATLRHDLRLLRESGSNGFRIIGLERKMETVIDGFRFIGFADRIDAYKDGEVRIVDYKTGHVEDDDININDGNAEGIVEKLFGEVNTGRPKIALQLHLYGQFAHDGGIVREGEKVVNSIYSTARLLTKPLKDVEESPAFSEMVKERLHGVLSEIADTSVPWKRTQDKHVCAICDFRSICGR